MRASTAGTVDAQRKNYGGNTMNNEQMKIFTYEENQIRTVVQDGNVWWVLPDVCKVLDLANPSRVAERLDEDEKKKLSFNPNSELGLGHNGATIISESGLYKVILKSDKPEAKKFTRWVTHEVLPSIRQNGGYISGQNEMSAEELMAKALVVAHRTLAAREARIAALEAVNQTLKIKSDYFDQLVSRHTLTNFRETAKELKIPPMKFVQFLLDNKFIYRDKRGRLLPYEAKNWDGLFEVKECYSKKNNWSDTQTLVTPKGRETFRLLIRDI